MYAESCRIEEQDLTLVFEYVFKDAGNNTSLFSCRYMNTSGSPVPDEINGILQECLRQMAEGLKAYCEKMEESVVAEKSN